MPHYRATAVLTWSYEATDQKAADAWLDRELMYVEVGQDSTYQGFRDTEVTEMEQQDAE